MFTYTPPTSSTSLSLIECASAVASRLSAIVAANQSAFPVYPSSSLPSTSTASLATYSSSSEELKLMFKGQDILNTDPKFLIDKDSVIRKLQDELRRKTITTLNGIYKCKNFAQCVENNSFPVVFIGQALGLDGWSIRLGKYIKDGISCVYPAIYHFIQPNIQNQDNMFDFIDQHKRPFYGHKQIVKLHSKMISDSEGHWVRVPRSFIPEDFVMCLQITHGIRHQLTAKEFKSIAKIAFHFGFSNTVRYCEQQLIKINEQPNLIIKNFKMAVNFNMERYLIHLLIHIGSAKHLVDILSKLDLEEIGEEAGSSQKRMKQDEETTKSVSPALSVPNTSTEDSRRTDPSNIWKKKSAKLGKELMEEQRKVAEIEEQKNLILFSISV